MTKRFGSAKDIENTIRRYLEDAALLARTGSMFGGHSELDGIRTPEQLSDAIIELGEAYIERMKAISKAAPVVRGKSISIYGPKPTDANWPSKEDERFLSACLKQLVANGYVKAVDADTYEEIAKRYPDKVVPSRVRGAEARRFLERRRHDPVAKRLR